MLPNDIYFCLHFIPHFERCKRKLHFSSRHHQIANENVHRTEKRESREIFHEFRPVLVCTHKLVFCHHIHTHKHMHRFDHPHVNPFLLDNNNSNNKNNSHTAIAEEARKKVINKYTNLSFAEMKNSTHAVMSLT